MVKNVPAIQETQGQSLGQEVALEKGRATHSSILAWRIPWTEAPGGYSPWGHKELDMTAWLTHTHKVRHNFQRDSFHPDSEVARWKWLWLYGFVLATPSLSLTTAPVQWKSYQFHLLNPSWAPHYPQVQAFIISCPECHCSHWLGPLADRIACVIQPGESSCWKPIIPRPSPTEWRPHYLVGPRSLSVL